MKKEELLDIMLDLFRQHAKDFDLPEPKRALAFYYAYVVEKGLKANDIEEFKNLVELK